MSDMHHDFSGGEPIEPAQPERRQAAPALPIEGHIVGAALAAEKMRGLCEQIILILQHAPRDATLMSRIHGEALDAWAKVDEHYSAYQAVLSCKGQG